MKRFRLSAKLAMAIIPIGLVALLATGFIALSFLDDSEQQSETAQAATVAAYVIDALKTVWDEQGEARQLYVFEDDSADLSSAVQRTDEAFDRLNLSVAALESVANGFFFEVSESIAEDVRNVSTRLQLVRAVDNPTVDELSGYQDVAGAMLAVLPKANSIVSDRVQGRELATAYFLAEGGQVSLQQEQLIEEYRAGLEIEATDGTETSDVTSLQATLEVLEDDFGAWALRANQTANTMNARILRYTRLPSLNIDTFPLARNEDILRTSENLAQGAADESQLNASESENEALLVAGVAAIVLLLALWGAYAVIRSVVRRVRGVTDAAHQVSEVDLPNLVDALQNPSGDLADLKPTVIESAGYDEVGELAQSFTSLHTTLIDVAGQQMDILRKGVSEIFVTLARRNRSLVDRQLALLDELESHEEDAETLGGYYKLDHLATRMRRNAESLLVLAGSEPTRIWANPLDVSEIIRAALGEVDEYQRVDIMALEPAMVSGRAVADIAHLMSELLDNGTQYSSPSDRVRVAGLFDPEGYMLTVSDSGIGMSEAKLTELNRLLASPPVLGLALQPTLGMYVVARLAARHDVKVQLISGSPGLTIRVLLPKSLIEVAPPKEDLAPEPTAALAPALAPKQDFHPVVGSSAANGSSPNGSFSNGSFSNRQAPQPESDSVFGGTVEDSPTPEAAEGTSALPGSVKGKHEHPGRQKAITAMNEGIWSPVDDLATPDDFAARDSDVPTGNESFNHTGVGAEHAGVVSGSEEFGTEEIVAETREAVIETDKLGSDEVGDETFAKSPEPLGELSKRIPGQALGTEEEVPAMREVIPPSEPLERSSEDEAPWWTKEVVSSQSIDDDSRSLWDDIDDEPADLEAPLTTLEPADERSAVSEAGLPVRTPGVSFKETDDTAVSSSASESGAIGIKSALSSFAGGRELAGSQTEEETGDTSSEGNRQ